MLSANRLIYIIKLFDDTGEKYLSTYLANQQKTWNKLDSSQCTKCTMYKTFFFLI